MKRLLVMVMLVLAAAYLAPGSNKQRRRRSPVQKSSGSAPWWVRWKTETGEKVTYEWFDGGFSLIGHVEN